MIKPKMAEGSRLIGRSIVDVDGSRVRVDSNGDLDVEWNLEGAYCSIDDAIRALAEGGQLPLWDAAVKIKEVVDAIPCDSVVNPWERVGDLVHDLCRVVDEMKESTL